MNDRNAVIDGMDIHTREELHNTLARILNLPVWYGRNLDALYDCLTDSPEETRLRIYHPEALRRNLGAYAETLYAILRRAETQNPRFHLTLG